MKRASVKEQVVVVNVLDCSASEDGGSALLEVDTNRGPLRLSVARSVLHRMLSLSAPMAVAAGPANDPRPAPSTDSVPPIVRFLTKGYARNRAENEEI